MGSSADQSRFRSGKCNASFLLPEVNGWAQGRGQACRCTWLITACMQNTAWVMSSFSGLIHCAA